MPNPKYALMMQGGGIAHPHPNIPDRHGIPVNIPTGCVEIDWPVLKEVEDDYPGKYTLEMRKTKVRRIYCKHQSKYNDLSISPSKDEQGRGTADSPYVSMFTALNHARCLISTTCVRIQILAMDGSDVVELSEQTYDYDGEYRVVIQGESDNALTVNFSGRYSPDHYIFTKATVTGGVQGENDYLDCTININSITAHYIMRSTINLIYNSYSAAYIDVLYRSNLNIQSLVTGSYDMDISNIYISQVNIDSGRAEIRNTNCRDTTMTATVRSDADVNTPYAPYYITTYLRTTNIIGCRLENVVGSTHNLIDTNCNITAIGVFQYPNAVFWIQGDNCVVKDSVITATRNIYSSVQFYGVITNSYRAITEGRILISNLSVNFNITPIKHPQYDASSGILVTCAIGESGGASGSAYRHTCLHECTITPFAFNSDMPSTGGIDCSELA